MKICYLANAQSIHTQRWAKHFVDRGHEVTVVSYQFGEIEGVRTIYLSSDVAVSHLKILWLIPKVRHITRKIQPDILHAHYATSYGLAGALTGKHPFIVTAWGSDVLITPEKSWVYRQMVSFVLSRADLVTTSAQHVTQHIIQRGYVTGDKVVTLPFGVDLKYFNPNQRTHSHGEVPSLIISNRHLYHGYDVDTYIRAIPKVLNSDHHVRFIIIGDGPLRRQLEQLAVDLGVRDKIDFRGKISHQEIPVLLKQSDIFVTTSPSDANNVSLNEAMACGVFPVATDIPANRAWIEHRRNGLTFPCRDVDRLADAIIEALQQPEWREKVMAQNWEIVRTRASWSHHMDEMERHYVRLLKEKNPQRIMPYDIPIYFHHHSLPRRREIHW